MIRSCICHSLTQRKTKAWKTSDATSLTHVASWCCKNHLLINPDKTKFLVFGTRKMLPNITIAPIEFLGKELPIVESAKDLGVIMDNHLSFNEHIDSLTSSLMGKLCMINRISHLLDHSTLFTVINSLVYSKLFYCSNVWSGTSNLNIHKLQMVQNFSARILSKKKKYEHITPTLKQLKLLPVSDTFYLRDAVTMFKCMNSLAPSYLISMFVKRSSIHTYNTRHCNQLQIPKYRKSICQQSFLYRATKIWNSLSGEHREIKSLKVFKNSVKRMLLDNWLKV